MRFDRVNPENERLLEEWIDIAGVDGADPVCCVTFSRDVEDLKRLGYIDRLEVEDDGLCSFYLTRKGLGYFKMKEAWGDMPGNL